jgi:type IV secretory pathway VirB2 component (pilin)
MKVATFLATDVLPATAVTNDETLLAQNVTNKSNTLSTNQQKTKYHVAMLTGAVAIFILIIGCILFGIAAWTETYWDDTIRLLPPGTIQQNKKDKDNYQYGGIACLIICGVCAAVSFADVYTNGKISKWAGYD